MPPAKIHRCATTFFSLFVVLSLVLAWPARARGVTPLATTTALQISPGGSVALDTVVTLKASVSSSGNPVSPGLVLFCDAAVPYCTDIHILGQKQLTSSGAATLNLILPPGVHQIKAVFQGTNLATGSTSPSQTLTVTADLYPTFTFTSASGTNGNYSLTGTVTSTVPSLTGTVQFLDSTNGNTSLAQAQLGPETSGFVFLPPTIPAGNYFSTFLGLAADFNGDGRLDQAVLSNGNVEIFLGNGDGTFRYKSTLNIGSPAFSLAVGDFNGDDVPDLAVASQENSTITICFGNGDGTFTASASAPVSISSGYPYVIWVADFNGDGNADMVVPPSQLFLGDGNGGFSLAPPLPYSPAAVGDFNGDGRADLLVLDSGLAVLLGNPDGTFTLSASSPATGNTNGFAVADFNGDGKLDLAQFDEGQLNEMAGHIYIYFGNGDGTFTLGPTFGDDFPDSIGIGDFNGDGIVDLALGNAAYPRIEIYLGPKYGNSIVATQSTSTFLLGDFNNDGKTDLIVGLYVGPPYEIVNTTAFWEEEAAATVSGISISGEIPGIHHVFARYGGNETHLPSSSTTVRVTALTTAVPVFSPASGAYPTAQTVSISDSTSEAKIYYTTDGTTPTTSSTPYTTQISVASTETLRAIAIAPNYGPSSIASEAYQIGVPSVERINFSHGFPGYGGLMQFNGSASPAGTALELTNGGNDEAGSAFYTGRLNVESFTTYFTFQLTNANADGFTFTIQNAGPGALGGDGGLLGYSRVRPSVAVKFDLYQNYGEPSNNSTGIFAYGESPTYRQKIIDLDGTGINLHSGDIMGAYITYDGTTLNLTLADLTTLTSWSHAFLIDIPEKAGGKTAYIGFTGSTGGETSTQKILTWSYQAGQPLYYPTGFPPRSVLYKNGSSSRSGTSLKLTNGRNDEAGSVFYPTPVDIQSFATDFTFQLTNANADGFTFTIQNVGPTALGSDGDLLGYSRIGQSVAVKFDLYQNEGDPSNNSTGIFVDGEAPIGPKSIDLNGTGINLHSGDTMDANLTYDVATLTLTITDLVTEATWSHPFTINIPEKVGGSTAYIGFTGATGGSTSIQQILSWTFE